MAGGIQPAGSVLRCMNRGGVADAARRKTNSISGVAVESFSAACLLPPQCTHSRKHRVAASHVRPSCGSSDACCSCQLGRPNYCRRPSQAAPPLSQQLPSIPSHIESCLSTGKARSCPRGNPGYSSACALCAGACLTLRPYAPGWPPLSCVLP